MSKIGPQIHSTHGKSRTPEFRAWVAMRMRCRATRGPNYKSYGSRGIKVCERWNKFENFIADMGLRPSPKHSVDRIDNNGDYEPNNCRWATKLEQVLNRRSHPGFTSITHDGKTMSLAEWSRLTGVKAATIRARLDVGWSVAKALTTPILKQHGRKVGHVKIQLQPKSSQNLVSLQSRID